MKSFFGDNGLLSIREDDGHMELGPLSSDSQSRSPGGENVSGKRGKDPVVQETKGVEERYN